MMQFLFVIVCFSLCKGFLLNNGAVSSGSNMSDQHYVYVMDQITQDRQNMKIMKQFVLQLQQEMKSTKQELMSLKQGNGFLQHLEISQLKTVSMTLKGTVAKLQNGYDSLKQELAQVKTDNNVLNENNKQLYMRLQSEISACNKKTLKISQELDKFTHSTAGQLKNVTELSANINSLNKKTDTLNVKINSLTSSSKAFGQDFLALLNKTTTAEKKIVTLVTENKKVSSELNQLTISYNSLLNKTADAMRKIETLVKDNRQVSTELNHLSFNQNNTIQKIDEAFHKISEINQTVALSSCSYGQTTSTGSVIKFPDTKTVYGISNIFGFQTLGKFVCGVSGVYLFSVHITSDSNNAEYQMLKNNMILSSVYVMYTSQLSGVHHSTGTGVMAVQLNVGDTLYVKAFSNMYISSSWSCMTVIKIR